MKIAHHIIAVAFVLLMSNLAHCNQHLVKVGDCLQGESAVAVSASVSSLFEEEDSCAVTQSKAQVLVAEGALSISTEGNLKVYSLTYDGGSYIKAAIDYPTLKLTPQDLTPEYAFVLSLNEAQKAKIYSDGKIEMGDLDVKQKGFLSSSALFDRNKITEVDAVEISLFAPVINFYVSGNPLDGTPQEKIASINEKQIPKGLNQALSGSITLTDNSYKIAEVIKVLDIEGDVNVSATVQKEGIYLPKGTYQKIDVFNAMLDTSLLEVNLVGRTIHIGPKMHIRDRIVLTFAEKTNNTKVWSQLRPFLDELAKSKTVDLDLKNKFGSNLTQIKSENYFNSTSAIKETTTWKLSESFIDNVDKSKIEVYSLPALLFSIYKGGRFLRGISPGLPMNYRFVKEAADSQKEHSDND